MLLLVPAICVTVSAETHPATQAADSAALLDARALDRDRSGLPPRVAATQPADLSLTPAERDMSQAKRNIAQRPDDAANYVQLAMALCRRGRETADAEYYRLAHLQLDRAGKLESGRLDTDLVRAWALLGEHKFAEALPVAERLNKLAPDNVMVYGLMVDAYIELGRYEDAEKACQWMLDLRPGNIPGLTRAAYLRELFGDVDGAVQLFDDAFRRTPPEQTEDRAWLLTQAAHLSLSVGRVEAAEVLANQALQAFPLYHYALKQLALVRQHQDRHDEAITLLEKRFEVAPISDHLFDIGVAQKSAGREDEAMITFHRFEHLTHVAHGHGTDASPGAHASGEPHSHAPAPGDAQAAAHGHEHGLVLIDYLINHANRPAEALALAEAELKQRPTIFVRDAYAWALHHVGRHAEAAEQIDLALKLGLLDAGMHYRGGSIHAAAGNVARARELLERSLALQPKSPNAADARRVLAKLPQPAPATQSAAE